jgi:hypothetical protein
MAGSTVEIVSGDFQPPFESNPRPAKFLRIDHSLTLLPQRSGYNDVVKNSDQTIWAINFHGTSDFDSVDLVVVHGDHVFLIPNIWTILEGELKRRALLPRVFFHHSYLSVVSIRGNTLSCRFYGFAEQPEGKISKDFAIVIKSELDRVEFQLAN